MLGVLRGQRDDWAEAERLIASAVAINPDVAAAQANLGNARRLLGRRDEALASYERALRLQPDNVRALKGGGLLLWEKNRPEAALAVYEALLAIEPDYADGWIMRGACQDKLGRHEESAESYGKALEFENVGDPDKVRYVLASMGRGEVPSAAPVDYLHALFDKYARNFDDHLVAHLGYRGPELLMQALAPYLPATPLDVLDLGCGTGLCGVLLRPFARRLAGVDLSRAMLAEAGRKQVYDELAQGELTERMTAEAAAFDLIVATDVFIYIGDLAPAFAAARSALRPGGLLAFSTERADDGAGDTTLHRGMRYAHAAAYLQRLAAAGGWQVEAQCDVTLRQEHGEDVAGQVVVLRRASA
jgi:predicted TPR repeat methyltransferase